jgi:hypothetical protein
MVAHQTATTSAIGPGEHPEPTIAQPTAMVHDGAISADLT